jgi:hypothetical protein
VTDLDLGPPIPAHRQNRIEQRAAIIFVTVMLVVGLYPGSAIGALLTLPVWIVIRPSLSMRGILAVTAAATCAILSPWLVPGWPWLWMFHTALPSVQPASAPAVVHSVLVEVLMGPPLLFAAQAGWYFHRSTLLGYDLRRYEHAMTRKKALEPGWKPGATAVSGPGDDLAHPPNTIRLGLDKELQVPFDLSAAEIAQHVFVPGASGTGKTTTLVRLADGALANGYGVVIIDAKGVGLGGPARKLAERYGLRYQFVDPDARGTIGYDVATGDAPAIANKLIGAFTFGPDAEIYKQIAMEVMPIIARALIASNTPVTLDAIYEALGKGGLSQLGRRPGAEEFKDRLNDLEESGGIAAAGYIGLQHRLGALMEGKFGEVFRKRPALNWDKVTKSPSVTYLSLSSTASSEDVELFGRVISQDLKQLSDRRNRAIEDGHPPSPVLIIYDEFAALREPLQVIDLLLQARGARMPIVLSTQFIPQEPAIRLPVLSAGVLIVHRLAHDDAEQIAKELGTHKVPFTTAQIDYETGESAKGSVRMVDEFNIHPNVLRSLPVGTAAVYARPTERRALVQVHRNA